MAKTNLKVARQLTLEDLIDEYGELSEQKNAIDRQQKMLRQQIESQLELPEGAQVATAEGQVYKAEKYLPEKTAVDSRAVYEYDEDTFWRVAKITLTDAQAVLPGDVLHTVTTVTVGDIPQLKISRRKEPVG